MISHISGKLVDVDGYENYKVAIITVPYSGIRYDVFVSNHTFLPDIIELYTHLHFAESKSTIELYGFLARYEKELFLKLWKGVRMVGPITSMAIVGRGVDRVKQAATDDDTAFFTQISGVGDKTAANIIKFLIK